MFKITFSNIAIAFGTSLTAGLFTVLGSGLVMFSKTPNPRVLSFGLASTGGVMVYVSPTGIFNKSSETFAQVYDKDKVLAAVILAFLAGMGSIALIDRIVSSLHETFDPYNLASQENKRRHIVRVGMTAAFVTIAHNSPESLATSLATLENLAVGMPLALAIAIHNTPEGISIVVPVYFAICNCKKAVLACPASRPVEPLGVVLGYTMPKPFLPPSVFGTVFGVIAGVMAFLALDELLPTAKRYSNGHETVHGLTSGMAVIALSLVLFHF